MSLADLTDDELRAELQRRQIVNSRECTGVAASFCPVHGVCTCLPADPEWGDFGVAEEDPNCPLHSAESSHAEARLAELGIGQ